LRHELTSRKSSRSSFLQRCFFGKKSTTADPREEKQNKNRDKKFCITRTFCAPSIAVSYCTSQLGFWCCRAQVNLNDDCADSTIAHHRNLLYLTPRSQGNCIEALCCLQAAEKKEERISSITDIVRPQSLRAIEFHLHADHLLLKRQCFICSRRQTLHREIERAYLQTESLLYKSVSCRRRDYSWQPDPAGSRNSNHGSKYAYDSAKGHCHELEKYL